MIDFRPDVIHCHDWQTGLVPVYLDHFRFAGEYYQGIKTVMTIHNLKFQGVWGTKDVRNMVGLPEYYFAPDKLFMDGLSYYNAKMHPGLSSINKYIVSYNLNENGNNLNNKNGDIYHPRFIEVSII